MRTRICSAPLKPAPKSRLGFSLIEFLVVLAGILLIFTVALPGFQKGMKMFSATAGEEMISSKLRKAHQIALTDRRVILVTFVDPNKLQISVMTSQSASSLLEEVYLPAGMSFYNGVGGAFPDDMSGLVNLRGGSYVYFGDGSARDGVTTGNLINGVIYFSDSASASPDAATAITVLGSTGRVRTYHYDSKKGKWL